MVILAVDLGKVRTGIAACDKDELLAFPVCVIKETNREKLCAKISKIVLEKNAKLIVLGLPKNMDGTEGQSAKDAREFGKILENNLKIKVELFDERCTTIIANEVLINNNKKGSSKKNIIDSASATVILQDYLKFKNS